MNIQSITARFIFFTGLIIFSTLQASMNQINFQNIEMRDITINILDASTKKVTSSIKIKMTDFKEKKYSDLAQWVHNNGKYRPIYIDKGEKGSPNRYFYISPIKEDEEILTFIDKSGVLTNKTLIPTINLVVGKMVQVEGKKEINLPPNIQTIGDFKKMILNSRDYFYKEYQGKALTIGIKKDNIHIGKHDNYILKDGESLIIDYCEVERPYYFSVLLGNTKSHEKLDIKTLDPRYTTMETLWRTVANRLKEFNSERLDNVGIKSTLNNIGGIENYIEWVEKNEFVSFYQESKKNLDKLPKYMLIKQLGIEKKNDTIALFLPYQIKITSQSGEITFDVKNPYTDINTILNKATSKPKKGLTILDPGLGDLKRIKLPQPSKKSVLIFLKSYEIFLLQVYTFKVYWKNNKHSIKELHATDSLDSLYKILIKKGIKAAELATPNGRFWLEGNSQAIYQAGVQHGEVYVLLSFSLYLKFPNTDKLIHIQKIELTSTVQKLYEIVTKKWKGSNSLPGPILVKGKKIPYTTEEDKSKKLQDIEIKTADVLTFFEEWKLNVHKNDESQELVVDQAEETFNSFQGKHDFTKEEDWIVTNASKVIISPDDDLLTVLGNSKKIFLYKKPVFYFTYDGSSYIIDTLIENSSMLDLTEAIGKQVNQLSNQGLIIHSDNPDSSNALNIKKSDTIQNLLYEPTKNSKPFKVVPYQFKVNLQYKGVGQVLKISKLNPYNTLKDLMDELAVSMNESRSVLISDQEYNFQQLHQTTLYDCRVKVNEVLKIFPIYNITISEFYTSQDNPLSSKSIQIRKPIKTFRELNNLVNEYNYYLLKYQGNFVKEDQELPEDLLDVGGSIELYDAIQLMIMWKNEKGEVANISLNYLSPFDTTDAILKKIENTEKELKGKLKEAVLSFQLNGKVEEVGTSKEDLTKTLKELGVDSGRTEVGLHITPINITFEWESSDGKLVLTENNIKPKTTFKDLLPKLVEKDKSLKNKDFAFEYQDSSGAIRRSKVHDSIGGITLQKESKVSLIFNLFQVNCKWYNKGGEEQNSLIPNLTSDTSVGYLESELIRIANMGRQLFFVSWKGGNGKKVYRELGDERNKTLGQLEIEGKDIQIITHPFSLKLNWKEGGSTPKSNTFEYVGINMPLNSIIKELNLPSKFTAPGLVFFDQNQKYLFTSDEFDKKTLGKLSLTKDATLTIAPDSFAVNLTWKENKGMKKVKVDGLKLKGNLEDIDEKIKNDDSLKNKTRYYIVTVDNEEKRFSIQKNMKQSLQTLNLIKPYATPELKLAVDTFSITLNWQENNQNEKMVVEGLDEGLSVKYLFNKLQEQKYFKSKTVTLLLGDEKQPTVITEEDHEKNLKELGIRVGMNIEVNISRFSLKATWEEDGLDKAVIINGLRKSDKLISLFKRIKTKENGLEEKENIGLSWKKQEQVINIDPLSDLEQTLEQVGITEALHVELKRGMLLPTFTFKYRETSYNIAQKVFFKNDTLETVHYYIDQNATIAPDNLKNLFYVFSKGDEKIETKYVGNEGKTLEELDIDESISLVEVIVKQKIVPSYKKEKIWILIIVTLVGVIVSIGLAMKDKIASFFSYDESEDIIREKPTRESLQDPNDTAPRTIVKRSISRERGSSRRRSAQ